jgi:hypothetical protein
MNRVHFSEDASSVNELILFAAVLNVVKEAGDCADEATFEGESCALMELVGVVLEDRKQCVLCTIMMCSSMNVEMLFFVLWSEGSEE